tara:strand:+ start:517 stop:714 length:198 start_codon:yes stop_codon:yes gene_type:complete
LVLGLINFLGLIVFLENEPKPRISALPEIISRVVINLRNWSRASEVFLTFKPREDEISDTKSDLL